MDGTKRIKFSEDKLPFDIPEHEVEEGGDPMAQSTGVPYPAKHS